MIKIPGKKATKDDAISNRAKTTVRICAANKERQARGE